MSINTLELINKLNLLHEEISKRPEGLDKFGSLETLRDVLLLVDELSIKKYED